MNRKQEMVSALTRRISAAGLELSVGEACFADNHYWERYPDGHCDSFITPSIEAHLACLVDSTLESLVKDDSIERCKTWPELWSTWGNKGLLKSPPELLHVKGVPILRIRHDSYLTCVGKNIFINHRDAYGNGNNGVSCGDLSQTIRAISLPTHVGLSWDSAKREDWYRENVLFRKAMVLRYPFEACSSLRTFHTLLSDSPEVFDQFITETDDSILCCNLDRSFGLDDMQDGMRATVDKECAKFVVALLARGSAGLQVFAILRYSMGGVTLRWSEQGVLRNLCVSIPVWDAATYMEELRCADMDLDKMVQLSEREYYRQCWCSLSLTLMTMAGIQYSAFWINPKLPRKCDTVHMGLMESVYQSNGLDSLCSIIRSEARMLRDGDLLRNAFRATECPED